MNAAKLDRNPKLQAILSLLKDRGERGATTWEIRRAILLGAHRDCMNVATEVSALRHNGFTIHCKPEGANGNGCKVYRYRLLAWLLMILPWSLFA